MDLWWWRVKKNEIIDFHISCQVCLQCSVQDYNFLTYFLSACCKIDKLIIMYLCLSPFFPLSSDDRSQKKPIYKTSVESLPSTCADNQPLVWRHKRVERGELKGEQEEVGVRGEKDGSEWPKNERDTCVKREGGKQKKMGGIWKSTWKAKNPNPERAGWLK